MYMYAAHTHTDTSLLKEIEKNIYPKKTFEYIHYLKSLKSLRK